MEQMAEWLRRRTPNREVWGLIPRTGHMWKPWISFWNSHLHPAVWRANGTNNCKSKNDFNCWNHTSFFPGRWDIFPVFQCQGSYLYVKSVEHYFGNQILNVCIFITVDKLIMQQRSLLHDNEWSNGTDLLHHSFWSMAMHDPFADSGQSAVTDIAHTHSHLCSNTNLQQCKRASENKSSFMKD